MPGLDLSQYKKPPPQKKALNEKNKGKSQSIFDRNISLGFNVLNDKFKEGFYLELAILISAGVDIKASLELLEKQHKNQKIKAVLLDIKEKVVAGQSLSDAIKSIEHFSKYEYFSLQIGEETGKIAGVLDELAGYYTKKLKQKRQIIQALSYPVIVLITSIGAIAFMMNFIVPMFSDVFKRFGGELPYLTKVIITISATLRNNAIWILLGLIGIVLFIRLSKDKQWFRSYGSRIVISLPVVGAIVTRIYLARFCGSFALLIGSKVPLLQAIELVKQMISFYPISISLEQVEKDIINGQSLHQSLAKFSIYDARLIALLKVGEEVNKLDFFFSKLATQYNEEVEHKASLLSSAIEPFIIIFLGLIVGVILVAMYLPLFELSTNMH